VTTFIMSSIPGQFPISLRAWPSKDDKAVPLSSLISRINSERGSFREVTEEGLAEELRKDEEGIDISKDDGESEVEDVDEEPDRTKELMKARGEILGQLE
jgi:mediator of RNA polymerase II transcription subunit 17